MDIIINILKASLCGETYMAKLQKSALPSALTLAALSTETLPLSRRQMIPLSTVCSTVLARRRGHCSLKCIEDFPADSSGLKHPRGDEQ